MRKKGRLLEYLAITSVIWGAYLVVLVPWMYYIIQMPDEKLWQWLWQGTLLEMVVAYPIGKLILKVGPKITSYCKSL